MVVGKKRLVTIKKIEIDDTPINQEELKQNIEKIEDLLVSSLFDYYKKTNK